MSTLIEMYASQLGFFLVNKKTNSVLCWNTKFYIFFHKNLFCFHTKHSPRNYFLTLVLICIFLLAMEKWRQNITKMFRQYETEETNWILLFELCNMYKTALRNKLLLTENAWPNSFCFCLFPFRAHFDWLHSAAILELEGIYKQNKTFPKVLD